jgi:hypothetical protein
VSSTDGTDAPDLEVRIVTGGRTDAVEEAAIVSAVTRVILERDRRRARPRSTWAAAGRSEATEGQRIRSRGALPPGT